MAGALGAALGGPLLPAGAGAGSVTSAASPARSAVAPALQQHPCGTSGLFITQIDKISFWLLAFVGITSLLLSNFWLVPSAPLRRLGFKV